MAEIAPLAWGYPVVESTAERDELFPAPRQHQRVQNLETAAIERWSGVAWVADHVGALAGTYDVRSAPSPARGDGSTDDRAGLAASDAAAAALGQTLLFRPGTYIVNSALSLTSPVIFQSGAKIKPASGVTVTISGSFSADLVQCFDLSAGGLVALAGLAATDVRAEWWGGQIGGTVDATTAIQRAGASGATRIRLTPGAWRMDGAVPIRANQVWDLSRTSIDVSHNTGISFSATTVDGWSMVGPFEVVGAGAASGVAMGIKVTDCANWRIDRPTIRNISGHGIYVAAGSNTRLRGQGGVIAMPMIRACYRGYEDEAGSGVEYSTLFDPHITACVVAGLVTRAGNTSVVGGHIVDNVGDGVQLYDGTNGNHGGFRGTQINHNGSGTGGYNLKAVQVTNGMPFVGCNFYETTIYLDRCKGIVIQDGFWDCPIYNDVDGSSSYNYVRNMYCPGSNVSINSTNSGTYQLIIEGCRGPGSAISNVTINDPAPVYVLARRTAGTSQSLTSGVAATLTFDAETFDRRNAFDPSTGVFTVPAGMAGMYRVQGALAFSGTSVSATASYATVRVNGSARSFHTSSALSTTALAIPIAFEVYLSPADTLDVQAQITATTPTFGTGAFEATLTITRVA